VDVSALVVAWNSAEDLRACLDAALAQEGVELEVVVVDNASTDGTAQVLAAYRDHARVTVLPQHENLGYAEGNNVAARHARGRHLLLLNPDCQLEPGCARDLVKHLDTSPGTGAAAALLRYPDGRPQSFLRRDATFGVSVWAFLEIGRRLDARAFGGRHQAHRIYAELDGVDLPAPVEVDCPAAACVLVPRALAGAELFDPGLPLFFNDADLYRRLRARGYRVEVLPTAQAVHRYGGSVNEVPSGRRRAEMIASLRRYVGTAWPTHAAALLWLLLVLDALACLPLRRTREAGRGTLGALGLPGGVHPWLAVVPPPAARARAVVRRLKGSPRRRLNATSRWWRRQGFVRRARWGARLSGCRLDLAVARTADLPRRVRFEFLPGRAVRLHVGERALVRPDLVLRLAGDLEIGAHCELRQGVVLNVKGRLELTGRNVLGRGAMVHADDTMVWEWGATTGEYVTVLDSDHVMDGSLVHVFDQPVTSRPVTIGAACLLGAHCVVLPGVRVGRAAVVGAGSLVNQDVPDGVTVAGVPARVLRPQDRVAQSSAPGSAQARRSS
jgi:hypothetical protein